MSSARRARNPSTLFPSVPLGFSQAIVASGARTVFISGQTAWDTNKTIVGRTLGEQTRQALRNLQVAIEAAGGTLSDIVSMRLYVVNPSGQSLGEVGNAIREAFTSNPPTSTWIGVASLAVPDFLIEIEAVGVLD
jgi:enamine deaminase RidA (YjgF/YER057c/UK114 family)